MDQTQPIRAVTPMPQAAAVSEAPLVLVVETAPSLQSMLEEVADFLRIRVAACAGPDALGRDLWRLPIAVLVRIGADTQAATLASCLAQVAGHDPGLPVLLVTAPQNEVPAPEDAVAPAGRLSNVYWMESEPGIRSLVEFLFMAERRHGIPGLMPS